MFTSITLQLLNLDSLFTNTVLCFCPNTYRPMYSICYTAIHTEFTTDLVVVNSIKDTKNF